MPIKTKHLLVFSPLYPPQIGGLESHAHEWNREMAALGHNITVWTPYIAGGPIQEKTSNIEIIRYPAWEIVTNYPLPKFWHPQFWKQWQSVASNVKGIRQLAESNVVVVSRTRFFFPTLMAFLFARLNKIQLLHIEHGSDLVYSTNIAIQTIARLYDHTLGRLVLRRADIVVANSKATAAFIKQLAGRKADAVIYRGIDKEKIAATKPANLSTNYKLSKIPRRALPKLHAKEGSLGEVGQITNRAVITFVGRLISGKGVHDLLEAFSQMSKASASWRSQLLLVGSGPEKTNLKSQAKRLNIASQVTFLGELPWEDTIAVIKSSDIIINPSYGEGLPTAVIEAALCGRAIVATSVGGTLEIVTDRVSALLIKPGNVSQMTRALTTLADNPAYRKKLAAAAYTQVVEQYSWPYVSRAYSQILKTI